MVAVFVELLIVVVAGEHGAAVRRIRVVFLGIRHFLQLDFAHLTFHK